MNAFDLAMARLDLIENSARIGAHNFDLDKDQIRLVERIENAGEMAQMTFAKVRGLIRGYDVRWSDHSWQTVPNGIEVQYQLPVINPSTKKKSRTWTHAGKIDGIVEYDGMRYVKEHKTCSEDITDPNAPFWRRLEIDSQINEYMLAQWQSGYRIEGTLYDVTRKPLIRLRKNESVDEYEERLFDDCADRPEWYFQRRTITRLNSDLIDYAHELWDVGKDILATRKEKRHYRNSGACMTYNAPCEFLGICSGHDSPDSDKWKKRDCVHSELDFEDDGRSVLTNSRIRCYQTCRRKHFYRYELGIERVDENEREALILGSLYHEALAAWWSYYTKEESGNVECASSSTASGVV